MSLAKDYIVQSLTSHGSQNTGTCDTITTVNYVICEVLFEDLYLDLLYFITL